MVHIDPELVAGRYRPLRPLGEGGAGDVCAALDELAGGEVALKRVPLDAPDLRAAFRAELGALRGLAHPHLARLLDAGVEGARGWMVAPLLDGAELSACARSWERAAPALADALAALHCLHRNGILHGDFKPANVLVGAGRATLIDLSCARSIDPRTRAAPAAPPRGTIGFVAPEVLRGEPADVRADLYGVGRTIEALGLRLPARVRRLVERLVARAPHARPADVLEVFDVCDWPPPTHGPADAAPTLGREALLCALDDAAARLARAEPGPRVITLRGPPGAGRTRLLDELRWGAPVRVEPVVAGDVRRALRRLAGAPVEDEPAVIAFVRALRAGGAHGAPRVLAIDDLHLAGARERALVAALAALLEPTDPLLLAATLVDGAPGLDAARELRVEPLDERAARAWLEGRVPAAELARVLRETRGLPGEIAAALRGASEHRAGDLADLSDAARARLARLVAGGEVVPDEASAALEARGLARFEQGNLRLARRADAAWLREALGPHALREAHAELAREVAPSRRVAHWLGAGERASAEAAVLEGALDPDEGDAAAAVAAITERWDVALACARALSDAGRPADALRA
ncbi:MAG: protein kinase, partial [Sandaracinaceae bacterium]|nr:protein kinase [Sandaracinaceae bacterium]